MTKIFETGHAKNVANFDDMVSIIEGYGPAYNPTREELKLQSLKLLSNNSKNVLAAVNTAIPTYSKAVAAREAAFVPLSKLVTRVMSSLKVNAKADNIHANALTYARKIQGKRAKAVRSKEQIEADAAAGKEVIEKSASQMSYDNRLDNFDKLVKLLTSVELYAPNEADLKVTSLSKLYSDLMAKNSAVISAATPLSNARIDRNTILYKFDSGLVDVALDAKVYVKSIFGPSSPQYKQISKLAFRKC